MQCPECGSTEVLMGEIVSTEGGGLENHIRPFDKYKCQKCEEVFIQRISSSVREEINNG